MDNGLFWCSDVLWVLGGDKPSPGTLFGVHQGTDYIHRDRQAFSWDPSQGTDYTETDKPSPGTLLRVQTTQRQTSLLLGPFSGYTRGQTT